MMKFLFFFIFLISFNLFASTHTSCKQYMTNNSLKGFIVTKTLYSKNEIHLHINATSNCSIDWKTQEPIKLYWFLARKYGSPCEDLLRKEIKDLLGFTDPLDMSHHFLTKLDEKTARLYIPNLPLLAQKTGNNTKISPYLEVSLKNINGKCLPKSKVLINDILYPFTRLHANIRFFSLREVFFYNHDRKVYILR